MKEIPVNSIEELEKEVEKIRNMLNEKKDNIKYSLPSSPLFRGQSNVEWNLNTTLERYTSLEVEVHQYNKLLRRISLALSSFTGKEWKIESYSDSDDYFTYPPNYELMVYLRHHGFPSPLLDWSQSLYVALYFAFRHATDKNDVAIYTYIESFDGGKGGFAGQPLICELGPYILTHKRHFLQQGQYTIAVKMEKNYWTYCSHEEVFKNPVPEQDILYKFILPASIKEDVLNKLFEMNINAYTLFSNEEALMEMLAFKELNNILE